MVLNKVRQNHSKYNSELIKWGEKEGEIYSICDSFVDQMYAVISKDDYSYTYITMFKSQRRTKELIESIEGVQRSGVEGPVHEINTQLTLDLGFK